MAVWAGLYVAAAVVCAAQLSGAHPTPATLAMAWTTAVFAYLLDRIKVRDRWLDPADPVAHPRRYAFLLRRPGAVRLLMLVMGAASAIIASTIYPWGAAVTALTAVGVLAYAGFPKRATPRIKSTWPGARVKDVFVVKNAFVAAGISGFALVLLAVDAARGTDAATFPHRVVAWAMDRPALLGLVASHLAIRVFADAVLCDIDDEAADREHRTHTLPTRIGGERAWIIAMALRLGLAISLPFWPAGPRDARLAWAVVTAGSTIGLRLWRPIHIRDVVDARFAVEAVCVWAALAWSP